MFDDSSDHPRRTRRRYNLPHQAHELTFTCHKRLPLLSKDRTRQWLVEALDRARKTWKFELWAYVIMPEHVHALLYPLEEEYDIGAINKAIKQPVAQKAVNFLRKNAPHWLNRLKVVWPTGRTEYRFWLQGGGYDRNIVEPKTAWNSVEYFHMNPVHRKLVERASDWPWSSARWYEGLDNILLPMDACPPDP